MYNLMEIAKYIINCSIDNEYDLDKKRLENILIILQGAYLSNFGKRLFNEDIFAKAEILYVSNFANKRFILEQKCLLPDFFSEKEKKLIDSVLQDIFEKKINTYLCYNNNGIIIVLTDYEIKNIYTNLT